MRSCAGFLFVPADAAQDAVDIVLLDGVVERDSLEQVVTHVGIEQEREGVFLVLEDVPDVVLVVFREVLDGDVVAGREAVLLDVLTDVGVAGPDDFQVPLLGPVLDEVDEFVEVLVVIDEYDWRDFKIETLGNLFDEVQRERRVLAAGPHDDGVLVLFEALLGDLDGLLDFVVYRRVVLGVLAFAVGVVDVEVLGEVGLL